MKLPEIIALGIYDSNIVHPNTAISKSRKVLRFEIELPIIESGTSYICSSSRSINTNMLIFAKPGQTRHTKFPYKCYYIHLSAENDAVYDTLMKAPCFMETDNADSYRQIFCEMINHHNSFSAIEDIKLYSLVLELIYMINNEINKQYTKKASDNNTPVIEKTLDYINSHLTEDLSLEVIAALNRISPIHFHNIFKKTMGKTLRKYVEEKRLKKAMDMILTTGSTLTEIAFECGFSSQSYFSYAFKRKMHCTPREYMQMMNNKFKP